jgi:outer membrane protein assembly factor BamB
MSRVAARVQLLGSLLLFAGCVGPNDPPPGTVATPPEARWVVRTAVGPGNSLIQDLAASPTTYVVGAAIDLIAYNTSDGSVRWRRTDVPSRAPQIVDDTLVVTLVAGESAAVGAQDGQVRWRTRVAGAATTYQPTRLGRLGIVAGFDGEVSTVDLYTGATRLLGMAGTLLGNPRTKAHAFAVTGDTLYVLGQEQLGVLGPLLIAQVDPATGAVLARYTVPARTQDILINLRPSIHGPLLVIPTGGSVVVVDRTTWAIRWRDSSANVGDPAIRNGRIYTGDGIGDVVVRELETGALVRRVRTNTASIKAVYPCGDDIFFTTGQIGILQRGNDRQRVVFGGVEDALGPAVWSAGTLFVNGVNFEVAIRCP